MSSVTRFFTPSKFAPSTKTTPLSCHGKPMPVRYGVLMVGWLISNFSHAVILTNANSRSYTPTQTNNVYNPIYSDRLSGLINQKQQQYQTANQPNPVAIYPSVIKRPSPRNNGLQNTIMTSNPDFNYWVASSRYRQEEVADYQRYLQSQLGQVPPMDQLLVSARSAEKCGHEPYEVPPRHLWANLVPTLRLVQSFKQQGLLPYSTVIRSVYRNPELNRCAGGAPESKHMSNGAVDVWIPEYEGDKWALNNTVTNLCYFWQGQGQNYNMGLGLYSTGAIHIDTQGWRKWGGALSGAGCG